MQLLTPEEKLFIQENLTQNIQELALKYHSKKELNYPFLIQQIAGRQKIKLKVPDFYANENLIFPPQLNLEQSSSQQTAQYKATLFEGKNACDLTAGFGIDSYYMAQKFNSFDYVEPNLELFTIATQNFSTLSASTIISHNSKAELFLNQGKKKYDLIYIDPSRRTNKGKVIFLEDYEPNIIDLQDIIHQKATALLIKTSPMLDLTNTLKKLSFVSEVHILAVKNEVKEVLYIVKKDVKTLTIQTVNFISDTEKQLFSFEWDYKPKIEYSFPLRFLYEPNKAIMKSGGVDILAERHELKKLHPNSNLYTSNLLISHFEGRIFSVNEIKKMNKKEFQSINKANISIRNFPYSVSQIRKKLRIKEGGDRYLFATTLTDNKPSILVCSKQKKVEFRLESVL